MNITLSTEPTLSGDGQFLEFVAQANGREVRCALELKALEIWFWVPPGAEVSRLTRAYLDGRKRIAVALERRIARQTAEPVVLRAEHFSG
ncbi:MAG: DUF1488 family protein [Pararobbsia sp.]